MRIQNKFWWFAGVTLLFFVIIIFSMALLFWQQLLPHQHDVLLNIFKKHFAYIFLGLFIILAGFGILLDWVFRIYILPLNKLVEEAHVIASVNPSHRIKPEGSKDIIRLSKIVNEGAERYEQLYQQVRQEILQEYEHAEDEKNILAALIDELPEGIVICNEQGKILLYNQQARLLLEHSECVDIAPNDNGAEVDRSCFIGLGRSIYNVMDAHKITHALDEISRKLVQADEEITAFFVNVDPDNRLLRVETMPLLNQKAEMAGFFLILTDITQQVEFTKEAQFLMENSIQKLRASSAAIRSSIEAILKYPQMKKAQLKDLAQIIHTETISLVDTLERKVSRFSGFVKEHWPLALTGTTDFWRIISRKAKDKLKIDLVWPANETSQQIRIDTYAFSLIFLFVCLQLKKITNRTRFECATNREGRFVCLDLTWPGDPISIEELHRWERHQLIVDDERMPFTFKDIIDSHNAEIWSYFGKQTTQRSYFRFYLPAAKRPLPDSLRRVTVLPEGRPEFYDFDLFNQPGQTPEIDQRPLNELTFTIFDTETTGLNPRGGDEIISIGAVRIFNQRLLQEERFDQLVDPQRPLPKESIQVHGIQPEMLIGKPTIDMVLPRFQQFCRGTILVAHNAAFDMRMLQMKEGQTGINFINPVLDTMLLSAVLHPAQEKHSFDAIAERFGIRIVGRHTAIGDAIATGEIFLKLIPLLAEKGILTLRQAREASQKTYYSRLKY